MRVGRCSLPSPHESWRSWEGMRKLWIFAEFSYRRRTGGDDGRIRSEKDKRLGVCVGGRVLPLVCGLEFKPNRWISKRALERLTIEVYGVPRGTGAKCAGGIEKEDLMRYEYDVVEGGSHVEGNLSVG